ncbi:hypothetical protein P154DRAFT_450626 [Amniculicola lignicola CBS 123094]|uniref:Programmed cell death protein 2 C-terminal domain-containing protein n=1 Tax=Amniculicola lignicola CBS 123094 TaxID=1392246 RepID=A0A6A5VU12_9PLEO|nr:hypothetical protein P154DRAFT_450626 [Amniculicola lignicola CBS 123094]
MAPYDSESSDEGEEFTETNVLLGYASNEPTGDTISHLGGHPTLTILWSWLDDKTTPSGALAKCRICNDFLTLLLELNGDLPENFPGHERRLYMFSCRRKTCRRKEGSVRGIRGVRIAKGSGTKVTTKVEMEKEEVKEEPKSKTQIGETLFGIKGGGSSASTNPFSANKNIGSPANPFSPPASTNPFAALAVTTPFSPPIPGSKETAIGETEEGASTTLPATFASKLRVPSASPDPQLPRPYEPWPSASEFPPPYPELFLDAEYETLDTPSTPEILANTRVDMDIEGSSSGKEDKDVYESTIDKTFQKFADRVGENAEQVLRYEFKGKPLLYSDNDAVGKLLAPHSDSNNAKVTVSRSGGNGIPRCQHCGADRVFEVQLTPHAITELEVDEMSIEGMEWGTIILGVCARDCKPSDVVEGEVGYLEEWVGVQWEEMSSRR